MQHGSGAYPGHRRLYTPNLGIRVGHRERTGEGALPDILWKISGVTTRHTSDLRPTVTNVPNAGGHPHVGTIPRERPAASLSFSDSSALGALRSPAYQQARRNSEEGRLLYRPRAGPCSTATPSVPKATRTMLPPLPPGKAAAPPTEEERSVVSATTNEEGSSPLEESEEEEEEVSTELAALPLMHTRYSLGHCT